MHNHERAQARVGAELCLEPTKQRCNEALINGQLLRAVKVNLSRLIANDTN
jgi:hypothetical protein